MRQLDQLYPFKSDIVRRKFIDTADENYIVARWCFRNGFYVDFYWMALHALEKYLKASLLLNERPAKKYGHDIVRMFTEVKALAPELLPDDLHVTENLVDYLHVSAADESTSGFLRRLTSYGQPDNRYQVNGFAVGSADILKIDQVVFAVRRLCQPLEAHFLGTATSRFRKTPNITKREWLRENDAAANQLHCRLEEILSDKAGPDIRAHLLDWNFPFAPRYYHHPPFPLSYKFSNPVLVRRLLEPLESQDQSQWEQADLLWLWVTENIQLPRELIAQYDQERRRLKALQQPPSGSPSRP